MDALAALMWQIDLGADEALEDAPCDRLASAPIAQRLAPAPAAARTASAPVPGPRVGSATADDAAQAVAAADTLEALRAAIAGFTCALATTATHPVHAEGDPGALLLLIGDAPSDSDDREGRPFTGLAGAFLDQMLASIDLDRSRLLLAPLIPWRPPGGRVPSPAERALCLPFLHRLILLARPRRILLAGALAARDLLAGPDRRAPRGAWHPLSVPGATPIPALATEDPGFLLRNPGPARCRAWADLRLLRRSMTDDLTKS